jgi:ketosteroid isomerase-like protein
MADAMSANEQLVRKFFDTLNAEDLHGLRDLFDPEASWIPMSNQDIPGAGAHYGHKGIIDEFLAPVRGLFVGSDPQNTIDSIISQGDLVAVETHGVGKLKNGKTYDNHYAWIVQVRNGKILAIREYMDTAYIQTLF